MFQIPLRMVRESYGYSPDETAKYCEIDTDYYLRIESDTRLLTVNILCKMKKLFKNLPLEIIYPGKEIDCVKHNRNVKVG